MNSSPASQKSSAAQDELAFSQIEAIAKQRLGLYFTEDQQASLRKRVLDLTRRLSLGSPAALVSKLTAEKDRYTPMLADTLSTNHTGFFRELSVLERIPGEIYSGLGRRCERTRIWSAASSTGQEAYSVAIMLAELIGLKEAQEQISILGTDLVRRVADFADAGKYPRAAMRDVSPQRQVQWFKQVGPSHFQVRDEVRAICTFRQLNLIEDRWPFSKKFSVILCRNVLYYFDAPTQARILARMHRVCEPNGWLLTGVSETLHDVEKYWRTLSPGVHLKI